MKPVICGQNLNKNIVNHHHHFLQLCCASLPGEPLVEGRLLGAVFLPTGDGFCTWVCVSAHRASTVRHKHSPFGTVILDSSVCVCLHPGLVHRPEPNPKQTREEEALGGRHADGHQPNWVRPAGPARQDQQQVDIRSAISVSHRPTVKGASVHNTHTHTHSPSSRLPTSEIIRRTAPHMVFSFSSRGISCKK